MSYILYHKLTRLTVPHHPMDSVSLWFVESVIRFNWCPQNALEFAELSSAWGMQATHFSEHNLTLALFKRDQIRYCFRAADGWIVDSNIIFQQPSRYIVSVLTGLYSVKEGSLEVTDEEMKRIQQLLKSSSTPLHALKIPNHTDDLLARKFIEILVTTPFVKTLECAFAIQSFRGVCIIRHVLCSRQLERMRMMLKWFMDSDWTSDILAWTRTESFQEFKCYSCNEIEIERFAENLIVNWAQNNAKRGDVELIMSPYLIPHALATVRKMNKNVRIGWMRATDGSDVYVLQSAGEKLRMFLTHRLSVAWSIESSMEYRVLKDSKRYDGLKRTRKMRVMSWLRKRFFVCAEKRIRSFIF